MIPLRLEHFLLLDMAVIAVAIAGHLRRLDACRPLLVVVRFI